MSVLTHIVGAKSCLPTESSISYCVGAQSDYLLLINVFFFFVACLSETVLYFCFTPEGSILDYEGL